MSTPTQSGLTPEEAAFLAESESISVIPRQKLESISLLGGATPALSPPLPADLPLWLALLLKRQGRANIIPPPWLTVAALTETLNHEMEFASFAAAPRLLQQPDAKAIPACSPPFVPSSTRFADPHVLPFHHSIVASLLLAHASDDIPSCEAVRRLLRDIREVRAAKLRTGIDVLEGGRVAVLNGVGSLEVVELGGFVRGVVDGLRVLGGSVETVRREREARGERGAEDSDEEML